MTVRLTQPKIVDIAKLCNVILKKEHITFRAFAQFIGKLVGIEPGVMYAQLYYKLLEIQNDIEVKLQWQRRFFCPKRRFRTVFVSFSIRIVLCRFKRRF